MKISRAHTASNFIEKVGLNAGGGEKSLLNRVGQTYEIDDNVIAQRAVLVSQTNNLFELLNDIEGSSFHPEVMGRYVSAITEMQNLLSLPYWNSPPSTHQQNFAGIRFQLLSMQPTLIHTAPINLEENDKYTTAISTLQELLNELIALDTENDAVKTKLMRQLELIIVFLSNANSMPLEDALDLCASAIFNAERLNKKNDKNETAKNIIFGLASIIIALGGLDQGLGTLHKIGSWAEEKFLVDSTSDNRNNNEEPKAMLKNESLNIKPKDEE